MWEATLTDDQLAEVFEAPAPYKQLTMAEVKEAASFALAMNRVRASKRVVERS